jgi:THAP domain
MFCLLISRISPLVYRKQWIKVLKVERDVPRHFRICSKHFKSSDFFPRHQMQKKLMLRPSAVPSQYLPTESTIHINERPESPENTSSSFISLDQSDSSTTGVVVSNGTANHHHLMNVNSVNTNTINNNTIILNQNIVNNNTNNINNNLNNNNNNHEDYHHHEDVKIAENHFTYHPAAPIQQATTPAPQNFQPTTYENFTTLSTVPYQEITQDPAYQLYDGTEIDRNRLLSVLNKDDYVDGTVTYVVNFVDY